LVENRRLEPTPRVFGASVGMTSLEFRQDLWRQKTSVPGLFYGVVCVILHLAFSVQCRSVTDEQTNGRTNRRIHDDRIYRASIASRGKMDNVTLTVPI